MTITSPSSRRSFIVIAGATLSGPIAAAAATTPAPAAGDGIDPQTRLAMLEEADAIRALNQAYARHLNAGEDEAVGALFADRVTARIDPSIRGLEAHRFGEQDAIEIAADRQSATATIHCTVQVQTAIEPGYPLVEMARAQGGGMVSRWEAGVLENAYVKQDGTWKIRSTTYRHV